MRASRLVFLFSLIFAGILTYVRPSAAQAATTTLNPVKIGITQEGVFQISAADLAAAHFDLSNAPVNQLQLTNNGQPVPIYVSSAGSNLGGAVTNGTPTSAADYIEFYAHPVNNTYTSTNFYVLSDTATSPMRASNSAITSPNQPTTTGTQVYHDLTRDPYSYNSLLTAGGPYTVSTAWPSDGDGHWDEILTSTCNFTTPYTCNRPTQTKSMTFSIPNAASTTTNDCTLTELVYGATATGSGPYTHHVDATLTDGSGTAHSLTLTNGTWTSPQATTNASIGVFPTPNTISASFPCSYVAGGGARTLAVTQTLQPGSDNDIIYYMGYQIAYPEALTLQSGQLLWNTPTASPAGTDGYTVSGVTANRPVSIWATNGSAATRYTTTSSTGSVSFKDGLAPGTVYAATTAPFTVGSTPTAISLQALDTTDLTFGTGTGNSSAAQYLVIAYPGFLDGSGPNYCASASSQTLCQLTAYHSQLTSKIVSINTIYDQFSNGQVNPEAIRTYITYAQSHLGTQYVVLAGGDTQDYHNYANCHAATSGAAATCTDDPFNQTGLSAIPFLYDDSHFTGASPTDNLYAVPTGAANPAPDVAIGRLPAFTRGQLQIMVNKSTQVMGQMTTNGSAGHAAFGADYPENNNANELADFHTGSDGMAAKVPFCPGGCTKYYRNGDSNDGQVRTDFLQAFNTGQSIINYSGHGSSSQWGHNGPIGLFNFNDIPNLMNTDKPSFVFQWGCEVSNFLDPYVQNIDLGLLNATNNGHSTGAALTIGSTGQDLPDPQAYLSGGLPYPPTTGQKPYFFGYLARGASVGVSLMLAKDALLTDYGSNQDNLDVVNSYTILGDPALTLPNSKPTVAHVSRFQAAASHHGVTLRWKAVTVQQIAGYRVQRHIATNRYATISRLLTVNHYVDLQGRSGDQYRLQVIGRHGEVLSTILTRAR